MENLLRSWDGESVLIHYHQPTQSWIFIAIHDRTLGMAMGGCRISSYSSPSEGLRDALRLASGMTLKWAAIDFPFGGGKAVLATSGALSPEQREELLLQFGELVASLGGSYGTGVDLGATSSDMDIVGHKTRWVFGRSPQNGGAGDPGPWTALGVFAGIGAACERVFGSSELRGRTVLVQGAGSVGAPLARRLAHAGARVLVSDALPARATRIATEIEALVVPPEATYETVCDVFSPCAIGGVLNERSIPRLQCRIIAGSANNQLEEDADAERLHERGILYVPDFMVNAGGAIAHGALEVLNWDADRVVTRVRQIGETLAEILADAARRNESPLHEAQRRAQARLEAGKYAHART